MPAPESIDLTPEQSAAVDALPAETLADVVAQFRAGRHPHDLRHVLLKATGVKFNRAAVDLVLARAGADPRVVAKLTPGTSSGNVAPVKTIADAPYLLARSLDGKEVRILRTTGRRYTVAVLPPGSTPPGDSMVTRSGHVFADLRCIDPTPERLIGTMLADAADWLTELLKHDPAALPRTRP